MKSIDWSSGGGNLPCLFYRKCPRNVFVGSTPLREPEPWECSIRLIPLEMFDQCKSKQSPGQQHQTSGVNISCLLFKKRKPRVIHPATQHTAQVTFSMRIYCQLFCLAHSLQFCQILCFFDAQNIAPFGSKIYIRRALIKGRHIAMETVLKLCLKVQCN